jgi:hypothetical protein
MPGFNNEAGQPPPGIAVLVDVQQSTTDGQIVYRNQSAVVICQTKIFVHQASKV